MAVSLEQTERIYTIQDCIKLDDLDANMQFFTDQFGESTQYEEKVTLYIHNHTTVKVTENLLPDANKELFKIATLGPYCKPKIDNTDVSYQNIAQSEVIGDVYEFMQNLGNTQVRSWIEKGDIFTYNEIRIRVFRLFRADDGQEVDIYNRGVVVETIRPYTDIQETVCLNLQELYNRFLFSGNPYKPNSR